MASRDLKGADAVRSKETLGDRIACLKRWIDTELLQRSMFLFFFAKDKAYIAHHYAFDELMQKALRLITDTQVSEEFLTRFDIPADHDQGTHWVEVLLRVRTDITDDECAIHMPDFLSYHQSVSLRMATHLQLTAENIARIDITCVGRGTSKPSELTTMTTTRTSFVASTMNEKHMPIMGPTTAQCYDGYDE